MRLKTKTQIQSRSKENKMTHMTKYVFQKDEQFQLLQIRHPCDFMNIMFGNVNPRNTEKVHSTSNNDNNDRTCQNFKKLDIIMINLRNLF